MQLSLKIKRHAIDSFGSPFANLSLDLCDLHVGFCESHKFNGEFNCRRKMRDNK
jgi:hypothetical protein